MATISKTGIQDGLTSKAEHLTRIIEALDGTANTEIIATGSFSGSFNGIHTGTIASASYAVSASFATTASFAVTASHALNSIPAFPFIGNAVITGSLTVTTGTITFSESAGVNLPYRVLGPPTVAPISYTANTAYGGHYLLELSGSGTMTLNLPAAASIYRGQQWVLGVSSKGGSSSFIISSSASNLYGNIAAIANPKYFNAAATASINGNSSRIGDSYTITSLGSTGWMLTGVVSDGANII
jgi:hypothetical protein